MAITLKANAIVKEQGANEKAPEVSHELAVEPQAKTLAQQLAINKSLAAMLQKAVKPMVDLAEKEGQKFEPHEPLNTHTEISKDGVVQVLEARKVAELPKEGHTSAEEIEGLSSKAATTGRGQTQARGMALEHH